MVEESWFGLKASDEELIERIRMQHGDELVALYNRYMPLIKSLRPQISEQFLENDDYYQEAMICLHRCVEKYDIKKQVTFGAFYKRVLRNHYLDIVRQQLAQKRRANYNTHPLVVDDTGEETNHIFSHKSETVYEDPQYYVLLTDQIKLALSHFSEHERYIFNCYLDGETPEMISQKMNRSPQWVLTQLRNCRQLLRHYVVNGSNE
ncbi:RNA polymerase sigma factor [Aerococcus suis]